MAQTSAEPIAAAAAATAAPDRAPRPDALALERVGVGGGSFFDSGGSFSPPLSRRLLRLAAFAGGDATSLTTSSFFSSLTFTAGAEPRRAGGDLRSTIFPVSARADLETLSLFATTISFFAFTKAFAAAACLPPATTSMLPLMAIAASASPSSSQLTPIFASAARTSSSPTSRLPARGTSPFTCCRSRGNSTG